MATSTAITGTVKNIVQEKGFGFITAEGQLDTFFHFKTLAPELQFNSGLIGRRVKFSTTETDKGPRAVRVWAAE